MAMSGTTLGDAIATAVAAVVPPSGTAITGNQLKAIWEAVGTAIVAHITTNAKVASGITVATTGTASAQTGATTSVGTIS